MCVVAVETGEVTTCTINLSDVKTYADHFDGGSAFSAANVTFSNGTVACNLPDGGTHVDGAVLQQHHPRRTLLQRGENLAKFREA